MKKKAGDSLKVTLQNRARDPQTPSKQQFQQWAQAALISPVAKTEVNIRLVKSAESAALNKKFRHKNGPTNILSFSYRPVPGEDTEMLGDLVICAELVAQEAQVENKAVLAHWAHLTVHGLLHLQGYDHEKSRDAAVMERLEADILQTLGFADPYHSLEKD
jgi:probable rRNA maturation factor